MRRPRALIIAALLLLVSAMTTASWPQSSSTASPKWTAAARRDALARAEVWHTPEVPLAKADLALPAHGLPDEVRCTFRLTPVHGTVRKFSCVLPSGELLRVKYAGPEPHGEVAASRLLLALGFGADRVGFVRRVDCTGCPWEPFATMTVVALARVGGLYERVTRGSGTVSFDWVAVERRFTGEQIATPGMEGWTFEEFSRVRTASPAQADALRLLAVFLAHWDNKAENQRLVCLSGGPAADGTCARPFAMLQDVGATFGPRKVSLESWRDAPLWSNRATCEVSMHTLPHGGATFVPVRISEAGRRFLVERLAALSDAQLAGLFRGARFEPRFGTVADWVATFKSRVAQLAGGAACPA